MSKILSFITFMVLTLGLTSHARDQVLSIITPVLVGNIETIEAQSDSVSQGDDSTWLDDLMLISTGPNLLNNPGFETGDTTGWRDSGLTIVPAGRTGNTHSGKFSASVSNRIATWDGPGQWLMNKMVDGKTYRISGWVRLENADNSPIELIISQEDSGGFKWQPFIESTAYRDRWINLCGFFKLRVDGVLANIDLQIGGPPAEVNFVIDDFEVVEVVETDWRTGANKWIEKIRKRDAEIAVLSPEGQPVINVDLHIKQTKHKFGFGCEITNTEDHNYLDFFKEHFEWALVGWSKWRLTEPQQGNINFDRLDNICEFCSANGISMRGHCLFWAV